MTALDILIGYLRDQWTEEDRGARAADVKQGDPHWKVNPVLAAPGRYTVRSSVSNRPIARVEDVGDDLTHTDPDSGPRSILNGQDAATHIARWDPARVLAEVESKRALLDDVIVEFHADSCLGRCTCGLDERVMRRVVLFCRPYMTRDDFPTDALPEVAW